MKTLILAIVLGVAVAAPALTNRNVVLIRDGGGGGGWDGWGDGGWSNGGWGGPGGWDGGPGGWNGGSDGWNGGTGGWNGGHGNWGGGGYGRRVAVVNNGLGVGWNRAIAIKTIW